MPLQLTHLLIVAGGGAIGAGGRHLVNLVALRILGPGFPWGTFIVIVVVRLFPKPVDKAPS